MVTRLKGFRRWLAVGLSAALGVIVVAAVIWREDIQRNGLDPKEPYQTYSPPMAPDYSDRAAWALMPKKPKFPTAEEPAADVFFVGPTTYDGGHHWNAPIDDAESDRIFRSVMAPNYAGPFVRVGRIFAPRYRQASLYSLLTLREDAREARAFAYGDVETAFRYYLDHFNQGRPIILVGVEQGGTLVSRVLSGGSGLDPAVRTRLVAAYLVETAVPSDNSPLVPCSRRDQSGCLVAWISAGVAEPEKAQVLKDRSLVWGGGGQLENLHRTIPVCVNPLIGAVSPLEASARLNLGAANATGLEWGARPALQTRQVSATCVAGVLRVSQPRSTALRPAGSWMERRKLPGFNLFYGDLEADAEARLAALDTGSSLHP